MRTLIEGVRWVNEGEIHQGSILIDGERIAEISDSSNPSWQSDRKIDARGMTLLPGVIDEHVHFREPGLTAKGNIHTESMAAAAGGVTTYFDMPNTKPQTTTLETLEEKFRIAETDSLVNYSFFLGAASNSDFYPDAKLRKRIPGIKLFMGASTGGMLVNEEKELRRIFSHTELPLMTHQEDSKIISQNTEKAKIQYGQVAPIRLHPLIRNEECCIKSTRKAILLAQEYGTRLHIAHISTRKELEMINECAGNLITGEICPSYLLYSDEDYNRLGARIKCNPAIKTTCDREALREELMRKDSAVTCIGTDHAPHLEGDKRGNVFEAASGMPMVQFSLPLMLTLMDKGILSLERLVEMMCHNPARLFQVEERSFIRKGNKADLVLVKPFLHIIKKEDILSRCYWSPLEGEKLTWKVELTLCNGYPVYENHACNLQHKGQAVTFLH